MDFGALISKLFGNKSADVIPSKDNVTLNSIPTLSNNGTWDISSTDAYAPGGSKYVAPSVDTTAIKDTTTITPTITSNGSVLNSNSGSGTIDSATLNSILGEIAGLDSGLNQQKANNQTTYQSIIDKNNAQDQAVTSQKDESLNNNDLSYLASQQSALVNSAKLRQSLLGTLIGMGALNGSGVGQANSTIGGALQTDLTGANDNYATNGNSVLSAYNNYQTQAKARKEAADEQLRLSNIGAENSFATNKQSYLKDLAGLYPTGSSQGLDYLKQAMGLGQQIQATTSPAQFDTSAIPAASFNAPDLAKYLSGTNQLSVGGQNTNGGVGTFYTTNKKRTDLTAPLALTTAS